MGTRNPTRRCQRKKSSRIFALAGLSSRIDLYFKEFRRRIPGAERHTGLWPSNKGRPMSSNAIYDTVCKRTQKAFGFRVNLHQFRHAAGTLWSIEDPENIRGTKDLLGHASYDKTTEAHYVMGQSRIAGRALADAIDRNKIAIDSVPEAWCHSARKKLNAD